MNLYLDEAPLGIHEVSGAWPYSEEVYRLRAALYSNALEHGILGLPSVLKQSPEGFFAMMSRNAR